MRVKTVLLNCQVCRKKGVSNQSTKAKKTLDVNGDVWENGDTCPECVRLYSKPLYQRKERKCRACSKPLPQDRWWHCHKCNELTEEQEPGLEANIASIVHHSWLRCE